MADTFSHTKSSWNRLLDSWRKATIDDRYLFCLWIFGFALMATAILAEFGFLGAVFILGLVIWKAASHA